MKSRKKGRIITRSIAAFTMIILMIASLPFVLPDKAGGIQNVYAATTLKNPRIKSDDSMKRSKQNVTWDCVWFGSYPQTEIVDRARYCGTYGHDWSETDDYDVDTSLYRILQSPAGWDANGNRSINGKKYKRIQESDATYVGSDTPYYNWNSGPEYHYFVYEPIKWRVLSTNGSTALILADKALDDQRYHDAYEEVTWSSSTIRKYLNGYGAGYSSNNFIDKAFSSSEQNGIVTTNLDNTVGGATGDKVFLLNDSDVCEDTSNAYGFVSDAGVFDEGRRCKSSTYAKAMGLYTYSDFGYDEIDPSFTGHCFWWLRSPGMDEGFADGVDANGFVFSSGIITDIEYSGGTRPALTLDLSSDMWDYAGTVSSNGTVNETAPSGGLQSQISDDYNLGDETYSFKNFGDDHTKGHCFGMSMTSAGYHNNWLDISIIGGNAKIPLFSFGDTATVRAPICHYHKIQGSFSSSAIVAGGSYYLTSNYDAASDWQQVIDYVKSHDYDNKGLLQIGSRVDDVGGHSMNFLRYENVDGQDRIYAYDNNFPDTEVYLYYSNGSILEEPKQSFKSAIDCIALRDVQKYLTSAEKFDATRAVYMEEEAASVKGYSYSYMETDVPGGEYVMYELPENTDSVIIIPKKDNASFVYMDKEYRFGQVTDETYGVLELGSGNTGSGGSGESEGSFKAYNEKAVATNNEKVVTNNEKVVTTGKAYIYGGQEYVVTAMPVNGGQGQVAINRAKNARKVTVPAAVKLADGRTYNVTAINANAFKGKGKIRTVTISKNVKKIKKNAFKGSKVTKIILKTKKLTKKASVKGSLKGSKVKTVQVKVGKKSANKKYVKKYKKVFTKKNAGRKATVK